MASLKNEISLLEGGPTINARDKSGGFPYLFASPPKDFAVTLMAGDELMLRLRMLVACHACEDI